MYGRFTKGLIIGGLIGASISVLTNSDIVDAKMRRNMIKSGKQICRRSRHAFGDIIDLLR
jgi:hypothetical protein